MLNKIFNPENAFFRFLGLLVDVAAFSLMWLICGATVVLLGPGTTALYDAMARRLRKGQLGGYVRFWESLKANFKVGCPAGLVIVALGYVLVKLRGVLFEAARTGDQAMLMLYVGFWVVFVVLCGIGAYIFPVLSRFTFGVGGLLATSVKLAFAHPLTTLGLGIVTAGCILLSIAYWLPALALPYVWAWLASLLLERVFKPFMEEQGKAESAAPELNDEEE